MRAQVKTKPEHFPCRCFGSLCAARDSLAARKLGFLSIHLGSKVESMFLALMLLQRPTPVYLLNCCQRPLPSLGRTAWSWILRPSEPRPRFNNRFLTVPSEETANVDVYFGYAHDRVRVRA